MKKTTAILIIILMIALLIAGCENVSVNVTQNETLVTIESTGFYTIYADKDTGVMYLSSPKVSGGGLVVMIDTDGSPKIWDGKK